MRVDHPTLPRAAPLPSILRRNRRLAFSSYATLRPVAPKTASAAVVLSAATAAAAAAAGAECSGVAETGMRVTTSTPTNPPGTAIGQTGSESPALLMKDDLPVLRQCSSREDAAADLERQRWEDILTDQQGRAVDQLRQEEARSGRGRGAEQGRYATFAEQAAGMPGVQSGSQRVRSDMAQHQPVRLMDLARQKRTEGRTAHATASSGGSAVAAASAILPAPALTSKVASATAAAAAAAPTLSLHWTSSHATPTAASALDAHSPTLRGLNHRPCPPASPDSAAAASGSASIVPPSSIVLKPSTPATDAPAPIYAAQSDARSHANKAGIRDYTGRFMEGVMVPHVSSGMVHQPMAWTEASMRGEEGEQRGRPGNGSTALVVTWIEGAGVSGSGAAAIVKAESEAREGLENLSGSLSGNLPGDVSGEVPQGGRAGQQSQPGPEARTEQLALLSTPSSSPRVRTLPRGHAQLQAPSPTLSPSVTAEGAATATRGRIRRLSWQTVVGGSPLASVLGHRTQEQLVAARAQASDSEAYHASRKTLGMPGGVQAAEEDTQRMEAASLEMESAASGMMGVSGMGAGEEGAVKDEEEETARVGAVFNAGEQGGDERAAQCGLSHLHAKENAGGRGFTQAASEEKPLTARGNAAVLMRVSPKEAPATLSSPPSSRRLAFPLGCGRAKPQSPAVIGFNPRNPSCPAVSLERRQNSPWKRWRRPEGGGSGGAGEVPAQVATEEGVPVAARGETEASHGSAMRAVVVAPSWESKLPLHSVPQAGTATAGGHLPACQQSGVGMGRLGVEVKGQIEQGGSQEKRMMRLLQQQDLQRQVNGPVEWKGEKGGGNNDATGWVNHEVRERGEGSEGVQGVVWEVVKEDEGERGGLREGGGQAWAETGPGKRSEEDCSGGEGEQHVLTRPPSLGAALPGTAGEQKVTGIPLDARRQQQQSHNQNQNQNQQQWQCQNEPHSSLSSVPEVPRRDSFTGAAPVVAARGISGGAGVGVPLLGEGLHERLRATVMRRRGGTGVSRGEWGDDQGGTERGEAEDGEGRMQERSGRACAGREMLGECGRSNIAEGQRSNGDKREVLEKRKSQYRGVSHHRYERCEL